MTIPWRWIAAAVAAAAVGLALLGAPLADLIVSLDRGLPRGAVGLVAYALIYAAAPLLMLPTLPFSMGAGFIFGFWQGLLAAMLGSILTASAGFLLSRTLLRKRIERWLRGRPRFAAVDRMVAREGWKIVGLLRLTWLHCGFSNYAYGLTAIRFRPYFLISAVSLAPGNLLSVYLGTAGGVGYEALTGIERERTTLEYAFWIAGTAVALGVSVLLAVKAKQAVEHAART